MRYLIIAISAITLTMIAIQDYRSRSVYWFFFPLLGLSGIAQSILEIKSTSQSFLYAFFNLFFLLLQFCVLKFYFFLRQRKKMKLIDKKIGSGDVLFLIAICFFFSPVNFIAFYITSLLFTVIVYGVNSRIRKSSMGTVPLAGLQAVFFIVCMCASLLLNYSLLNDGWLMNKLFYL